MPGLELDPFIRSGIVRPEHLVGREEILRVALSNLLNEGGSVAIDGDWLTGKSSVLHFLSDPLPHLSASAKEQFSRYHFVPMNCQGIGTPFNPPLFWRGVLEQLRAQTDVEDGAHEIEARLQFGILDHTAVHSVLDRLPPQRNQLVLLLDDFAAVLGLNDINAIAHFANGLRSLITRHENKAHIVVSTYRPLQVIAASFYMGYSSSPFENYFATLGLRLLREEDVKKLITIALAGNPVQFSEEDARFIARLSGGHPYLAQLAGSVLYNSYITGPASLQDAGFQGRRFIEESQILFTNMWSSATEEEQLLLMLLSLQKVEGMVPGRAYDLGDLDTVFSRYARELNDLARRGQISRSGVSAANTTVFSPAYQWWILKEIESGEASQLEKRERIIGNLLTRDQAGKVIQVLHAAYKSKDAIANMAEWTVRLARRLAIAAGGGA